MKIHKLFESVKPQMIVDLEKCFGDLIWRTDFDYELSEQDLHLMFDIINNGLFNNTLSRQIPKTVLKEDLIDTGPQKYRGLKHALAAFSSGVINGMPTEIIMVKHLKKDNFFIIFCALMHEMIHMHDYHNGPMHRQLTKYGAICGYNLNYLPNGIKNPRLDDFRSVNIANANIKGLDIRQLPDEIISKINDPEIDTHPRQYQFPGERDPLYNSSGRPKKDEDGRDIILSRPLPKKYDMNELDGFYDVHGPYFKEFADKANAMGFGVCDVFSGLQNERQMRKVFESAQAIENEAQALYSFFNADHKAYEYKDPYNWYVEIF